ncbi:MAG: hypothetical protein ACM3SV_00740 [Betaproteobacteria bacterium]
MSLFGKEALKEWADHWKIAHGEGSEPLKYFRRRSLSSCMGEERCNRLTERAGMRLPFRVEFRPGAAADDEPPRAHRHEAHILAVMTDNDGGGSLGIPDNHDVPLGATLINGKFSASGRIVGRHCGIIGKIL